MLRKQCAGRAFQAGAVSPQMDTQVYRLNLGIPRGVSWSGVRG